MKVELAFDDTLYIAHKMLVKNDIDPLDWEVFEGGDYLITIAKLVIAVDKLQKEVKKLKHER